MAIKKETAEMPVEQKLKNLYQLQTLLTEIDRLKALRGELPQEVEDLDAEIEGLTTRLGHFNEDVERLNADITAKQGKIAEAQAAIERYKEQINDVKNNRENDMLSRAPEERRADLDVKKSELEEITAETKAEEEKLREKAKNLELAIEPRLLTAFKRIRNNSRNGLGIVYVERDACGGCFNKIPPQCQLDIRMRKKIIVCEYCGRIMIDPDLAGVKIEKAADEKPKRRIRKTAAK